MRAIRSGGIVYKVLESAVVIVLMVANAGNAQSLSSGGVKPTTLSENITRILNELVNPDGPNKYDKRLRPKYGGEPVDVGITIHVSSISAVSEVEMDYTLDIYLRQMWTDPRLKFDGIDGNLTIGVHYMQSIWVPDTFFPNEKKSFFHEATTHNSFLRITPQGAVLTSQRLTVTATCPMNLHLFPLDSQECTLEIESYGYTTESIRYCWSKKKDNYSASVSAEKIKMPQFALEQRTVMQWTKILSSGNYSRLSCKFIFARQLGFYIIQIYLPSTLIVVISWVSFWISRDATPARVSLGVTTVLTMTTLMTTTNAAMPKVSYIKSIDIFLLFCFIMVFASLLEYAAVGYLNKYLRRQKEKKKPRQSKVMIPPPGITAESMGVQGGVPGGSIISPQSQFIDHVYSTRIPMQTLIPGQKLPCYCDPTESQPGDTTPSAFKIGMSKMTKRRGGKPITPSRIDKYSRAIFPAIFLCFSIFYWSISMHFSKLAVEQFLLRSQEFAMNPEDDDCMPLPPYLPPEPRVE